MSNIFSVIRFEVIRNLKKPSFWIAAFAIPVVFAAYIGICAFAGYNAGDAIDSGKDTTELSLALYDGSNIITTFSFKNANGDEQSVTVLDNYEAGMQGIQDNTYDVFYYVVNGFMEKPLIRIYAKPDKIGLTNDYSAPIKTLLDDSIKKEIGGDYYSIIKDGPIYDTTLYDQNNQEVTTDDIIRRAVAPCIAIALFYLILIILGNRLSVSMVEEKENRISELLLTSLKPIDLILGKTISLMLIGIIQITVILLPMLALALFGQQQGIIPIKISDYLVASDLLRYGALLIVSYFFFTVCNILLGTLTSTAKDASQFAGVVILPMFLPFMLISVFINGKNLALMRALTFIPLSAPTSIMLRGIFNNIESWEFLLGLGIVIVSSLLLLKLATYIFCRNAIATGSKIDLKKTFGSTRSNWAK